MNYMIKPYNLFLEWLQIDKWLNTSQSFESGFVTGMTVVLVLLLLYVMVKRRFRGPEKNKGITVSGENGDLFITLNAIREFIKRIISGFSELHLEQVKLRQKSNSLHLVINLSATPDADLIPLRDAVQNQIVTEGSNRLGLDMPLKVDISIRSLEANKRRISKKHSAPAEGADNQNANSAEGSTDHTEETR
mgnify:CR=1 FL=1